VYVDDLDKKTKFQCLSKQLVGIDPGTTDLINCSNGDIEYIKKANCKILNTLKRRIVRYLEKHVIIDILKS
jgi:transposase